MGADFVYSLAPAAEITDRRAEELKTLVAGLERDDFEEGAFDEDMDLNECRLAITEAIAILDQGRRDMGTIATATMPCAYLISGGMSWGGAPTDSQELLSRIEACDRVWRQLEAWALEDKNAARRAAEEGK